MSDTTPNDIFQFSTYAALQAGFNRGQPRTTDLTSHGTDGIGVYDDGSLMILLRSQTYSILENGEANTAPMKASLPWAMVTIFEPAQSLTFKKMKMRELNNLISSPKLPISGGVNTLMPFKIEATFESVSLRSGHDARETSIYNDVQGVVFGFVVPAWLQSISGPRINCHFVGLLSRGDAFEPQMIGGRVVDFNISQDFYMHWAKCGRFHVGFPQDKEWENIHLK